MGFSRSVLWVVDGLGNGMGIGRMGGAYEVSDYGGWRCDFDFRADHDG